MSKYPVRQVKAIGGTIIAERYLGFTSREDAQSYCEYEHANGNIAAYVSTLNSHMMTSDPMPIVVNSRLLRNQAIIARIKGLPPKNDDGTESGNPNTIETQ